jgi:predicted Fe-Mo cluster-binding NifX family protein
MVADYLLAQDESLWCGWMKKTRVLVPLHEERVAPRFDLAAEVRLATIGSGRILAEKLLILPQPSAEQLCHLVLNEAVDVVICGGIEEEHYDYLTWKKVAVIDDVIGPCRWAVEQLAQGRLDRGQIFEAPVNSLPTGPGQGRTPNSQF